MSEIVPKSSKLVQIMYYCRYSKDTASGLFFFSICGKGLYSGGRTEKESGQTQYCTSFGVAQSEFASQVQEMRVKVGVDSRTNSYARLEIFCLAEIPKTKKEIARTGSSA